MPLSCPLPLAFTHFLPLPSSFSSSSAASRYRCGLNMSATTAAGGSSAGVSSASTRRPRLVVFDLDGTLWYPEMYMLWGSPCQPFIPFDDGNVMTQSGTKVKLMGHTRTILRTIDRSVTEIGIASSTDEPDWADECMQKIVLDVDGERKLKMADVIRKDAVAIQKGNKSGHFQLIHRQTKIPYKEMIFFDNEPRNIRAVEPLGVQCVLTPDGMTKENWEQALAKFARSK